MSSRTERALSKIRVPSARVRGAAPWDMRDSARLGVLARPLGAFPRYLVVKMALVFRRRVGQCRLLCCA